MRDSCGCQRQEQYIVVFDTRSAARRRPPYNYRVLTWCTVYEHECFSGGKAAARSMWCTVVVFRRWTFRSPPLRCQQPQSIAKQGTAFSTSSSSPQSRRDSAGKPPGRAQAAFVTTVSSQVRYWYQGGAVHAIGQWVRSRRSTGQHYVYKRKPAARSRRERGDDAPINNAASDVRSGCQPQRASSTSLLALGIALLLRKRVNRG